jgi:hypothetical protein
VHSKNEQSVNIDLSSILEGLARAKIKFILVGGLENLLMRPIVDRMKVIRPRKNDFLVPRHRLFKSRLGPIDILAFI